MATKLTLTVEKEVIEKAKIYAQKTGRSLSKLIENHLENLINEKKDESVISPRIRKIAGSVKLPKGFDEKKELRKMREKKYL